MEVGVDVLAQLFFAALMVNPALHSLHMAAPCLVQKVPLIATPFSHSHLLAKAHTHTRTNIDNHVNGVKCSFRAKLTLRLVARVTCSVTCGVGFGIGFGVKL